MAQVPRFAPENGIFSPGGLLSQYKVGVASASSFPSVCKSQLTGWKKPRLCKPPSLLSSTVYDKITLAGECSHSEGSRDLSRQSFFQMDEHTRSEERVLSIDILLVQIMGNLSPSDLKTCRLVNHRWNDTSTKILQNRQSLQISSYFLRNDAHREYSVRVRHNESSRKDHDLQELTDLMSQSWNFPCNSFRFFDGNVITPALQVFFDTHGSLVRSLLLDVYFCRADPIRQVLCDFPRMGALEKLLNEQASKLETLTLINFPDIGYLESASLFTSGQTTLPYLKYLELEDDEFLPFQVYVDIIEAAVNLQHITIESLRHIQYLLDTNRTSLIYGLTFRFSEEYLRLYHQLLRTGKLQLQKLVLRLGNLRGQENKWGSLSATLFQILSTNASTLKAIQWQPIGVLSGFGSLPPLRGVTQIGIADVPGDYVSIFPPDFSLAKVFPNLVSVSIELAALARAAEENGELVEVEIQQAPFPHFEDYFSIAPVTTLTSLSISSAESLPLSWFEKLAEIFPNVKNGKFSGISSKDSFQSLWNFKSLEIVEVKLEISSDVQFGHHGIDAALTGFDPQDCQELAMQNYQTFANTNKEVGQLSLANLPDLKALCIIIEDKQPYYVDEPLPTLLSRVTKRWTRQTLPSLHIQLELVTEDLANIDRLKKATSSFRD